jgi:hypothetical protein
VLSHLTSSTGSYLIQVLSTQYATSGLRFEYHVDARPLQTKIISNMSLTLHVLFVFMSFAAMIHTSSEALESRKKSTNLFVLRTPTKHASSPCFSLVQTHIRKMMASVLDPE